MDNHPDGAMSSDELHRKIQELETKLGVKHTVPAPVPQASPELWPGGPSVDTNDIRLAQMRRKGGNTVA